jgi:hypothetical protein
MPNDALLSRIRAEYLEMPGLRLKLAQAQRLWGLERRLCERVLEALIDTKFLRISPDGTYARITDGAERSHPRSATADIRHNARAQQEL